MSKFADIDIDPGIIRRAAKGDARAHEIIYRAFSAPVYSICLRFTKVPAHAEDLTQDVFLGAVRGIAAFDEAYTLDQFLFVRPVSGAAQYTMPLDGLYLCGAGTHPGGGVSGAAGRNAARVILQRERGL